MSGFSKKPPKPPKPLKPLKSCWKTAQTAHILSGFWAGSRPAQTMKFRFERTSKSLRAIRVQKRNVKPIQLLSWSSWFLMVATVLFSIAPIESVFLIALVFNWKDLVEPICNCQYCLVKVWKVPQMSRAVLLLNRGARLGNYVFPFGKQNG